MTCALANWIKDFRICCCSYMIYFTGNIVIGTQWCSDQHCYLIQYHQQIQWTHALWPPEWHKWEEVPHWRPFTFWPQPFKQPVSTSQQEDSWFEPTGSSVGRLHIPPVPHAKTCKSDQLVTCLIAKSVNMNVNDSSLY